MVECSKWRNETSARLIRTTYVKEGVWCDLYGMRGRACAWETKREKRRQTVPSPVGSNSNKRTRRWHAVVQIHRDPLICAGGRVDGHQLDRSPLHLEG